MLNPDLTNAITDFTSSMLHLSENDLERTWVWKDHDEEGVRFAFFVTLQELHQLAICLAAARRMPTQAQRILGQYHAQYMDLQAALLGLSREDSERAPAEGQWPVRRVYAHILSAEINFSIVVRYALEKHRAGIWTPERASDEDENRIIGMNDEEYEALQSGPLDGTLAYHRNLHSKNIDDFSRITDDELEWPSTFWEETRFPIRHRLQRFTAHMLQHTVQIDKTLAAIGLAPSEPKRLIRYLFAALAAAQAARIGAGPETGSACSEAADVIRARVKEIQVILK